MLGVQAINNIKKIEGLERNEKLRKLDLTVNFIDLDGLLGVEKLKVNLCLEEIYLLGNPCSEFEGYRYFVIGTLPQLKKLDGNNVTATERILAGQQLKEIRERLVVAAKERVRQMGGNPDLVDAPEIEEDQVPRPRHQATNTESPYTPASPRSLWDTLIICP